MLAPAPSHSGNDARIRGDGAHQTTSHAVAGFWDVAYPTGVWYGRGLAAGGTHHQVSPAALSAFATPLSPSAGTLPAVLHSAPPTAGSSPENSHSYNPKSRW